MPKRVPTHKPAGYQSRKEKNAEYDKRRLERNPLRALYASARWFALRVIILTRDPYCVRCLLKGIATPSTTVNHKLKAQDRPDLFFDQDNLEGVCAPCHSSDIQKEERANAQRPGLDH